MRIRSPIARLPLTDRPIEVASPDEMLAAFEAHRLQCQLSQYRVAKLAGYAGHNYEAWVGGAINSPNLHTLFDYAEVLGLRLLVIAR